MRKLFVFFVRLIIFTGIIYIAYNGILFVDENKISIVYSKIFGRINKVYSKNINFVPAKCIPLTCKIKTYSNKKIFRIKYKNHLSFLDKNFDIVRFEVEVKYFLDKRKILNLSSKYNNDFDIINSLKNSIDDYLDTSIYNIINSKQSFKNFIDNCSKEIENSIKGKYNESGIVITKIKVINKDIPLIMDFSKYKQLAIKSIQYEREYKFKLREIELEKLKLRQLAVNKVEYLKIIGDYIKENPLILNYLLIEKIKDVNTMVLPLNSTGLWFKDNVNNKIIEKLLEQEKKK